MKKALSIALLMASVLSAEATSVSLSSLGNTGPAAYLNDGVTLVPNGSLVRIGTFSTPGDLSTFVQFGTSTVKTYPSLGGNPGKVVGSVASGTEEDDTQFNGKDIYIWIYNAATEAAATQSGIFRATVNGTGDGWVFKDNNTGSLDADSSALDVAAINVAISPPGLNGASVGTGVNTATSRLILAAVPEPTTATFAGLVGLLALSRRRR